MERMKRAVCLLLCFVMVVGLLPMAAFAAGTESVSGKGNLVGGTVYTLDTDGVTANKNYLIVNTNSGTGYALTNNGSNTAGSTNVTINDGTITVEDDSSIAWTFSGSTSGTISNNSKFIRLGNSNVLGNSRNLTIENQNNGAYRISYNSRYLACSATGSWSSSNTTSNVYLYEYTSSSSGEAVTFTVAPGSVTLAPNGTQALTGTVTVAGETVDLGDYTITWASSNTDYATVSENGTVTGVADGTANITATLSAVNGTALQDDIVLTIPVTVQSKAVVAKKLTGNDPVTTKQNVEPDFSKIKLEVTYDDGTMGYITTENGLTITGYDITTIGYSYATISYAGEEVGTVRVTVEGNPYEGVTDATSYPEYPADGAVRIDKHATEIDFENTGVVQVELDVAGVSVKSAVDVILIMDISNSMSWNDTTYDYNDTTVTAGTAQRLNISRASAKQFVNTLLTNEDGSETNNSVTVLAFAGIDGDYNDHSTAKSNDDVYQLGDLAMTSVAEAEAALDQLVKATTGGTNYDYAFQQAYALAGQLYAQNGNEVHIVFMTDGVPTHYNGVYYKSRNSTDLTAMMNYVDPTTGEQSRYTSTGNDRNGNDIDATATQTVTITYNDGTTANKTVTYNKGWSDYVTGNKNGWAEKVKALDYVAKVYSIGFGMKNGSVTQGATSYMPTLSGVDGGQYYIPYSVTKAVLEHVSSTASDYYEAENEEDLTALYKSLATKIKFAGTQAQVTDIVDSNFDLQLTQTTGTAGATTHGTLTVAPTIEIKAYELWTKEETTDNSKIGTRKTNADGSYVYETLETVTFSEDGTAAYSNKIDNGETNILTKAADGTVTIAGFYFTYTCTPESVETFSWKIGNITDKEVALSYYAYLTGTMEGTRSKGLYYTNQEATLEYLDINNQHATKVFPIPAVAWGGASTAYEFYLVNFNGEPCDRNGNVVPFANRVIITGPYYEELYLNQEDENQAKEIVAAYVLPAGYTLYDETAKYTVITASGTKEGSLEISDPGYGAIAKDETYTGTKYKLVNGEFVALADGETYTGTLYKKITAQTTVEVSATKPSYIQSHVAFGVIYNMIPDEAEFQLTPDRVVIDYGKEITVNIANGNEDLENGYTAELVGFSKYYADVELKTKFSNTSAIDNYQATYGIFSIESNGANNTESVVRYKPTAIVDDVEMIFCVIKMHNATTNDTYYMVDWLTVIPATSVYYETDFADDVFTKVTSGEAPWSEITDGSAEADDDTQDGGTIGVNQTYGYDSTYDDDTHLSDGDSWFVHGQGYDTANGNAAKTYVLFNFEGTGFELISRTGAAQGLIKVEVFSDAAMTKSEKTISVLNKSESDLELYQIPVVSINDLSDGTHYVRVSVDQSYTATNAALAALNRGDEFYFDAIRVFDPAKGDAVAETAYIEDGESNRQLEEVRGLLIDAETFNALTEGQSINGAVFVDRTASVEGEDIEVNDHTVVSVATYSSIGPNNEVYLAKDQAVAFKIKVTTTPASFDIGAKSITGAKANMKVTVASDADLTNSFEFEQSVASSTAQNYNLLQGANNASAVFTNKEAYVVITNTGDGVLSITDIKVAYGNAVSTADIMLTDLYEEEGAAAVMAASEEETVTDDPYAVTYTVDAQTFALARTVMTAAEEEIPEETEPETTEPEETEPETTEPEETEPETTESTEPEVTEPETTEPEAVLDIIKVSANTSGSLFKRKTTFTVVTTQDVASLKVAQTYWFINNSSMTYADLDDGTRVWTVAMPGLALGSFTFTAYGADGTRGDSASIVSWGI